MLSCIRRFRVLQNSIVVRGSSELVSVRRRIEMWRRTRERRTAMPEALWKAAAELARLRGVHPIARALRLDYYSLKGRLTT